MSLISPSISSPSATSSGLPVSVTLKPASHHAPNVTPALPAWALGPFARPGGATGDGPVIAPNPKSSFHCPMRGKDILWEALHTFNPAAIVKDGKIVVLYRAEDDTGDMGIGLHTSRLGMAESVDGVHFTRLPAPVFYPADDNQQQYEWTGGCEDPRLVESPDGTYVMTYTQWDLKYPRLAVATSRDLRTWTKHGPAFVRASGETYRDYNCKAGSIVCKVGSEGRLVAATIDGKFWMYWGEFAIRLAWSHDLTNWHVVEDAPGVPTVVMRPIEGTFDAPLSECGPPAVLTEHGIVLLYNAKNEGDHAIPDLSSGAYAGGQALFDAANPTRLIERLKHPFLKPERAFERAGQYAAGTTFIEGLALFNGRWWLYYGCADSLIGVASAPLAR